MPIADYLNQTGYVVTPGIWELYDDVPDSSPITLTGNAPTSVVSFFRCRVTVTSVTDHTDCTGTVVVGSDSLTFSYSGQRKTTTTNLVELPVVTYSGLDCNIKIECIDTGGADIRRDVQAELSCRFQDTQKAFQDAQGNWSTSAAIVYTNETDCEIGTQFSYADYDYHVSQVNSSVDRDGTELFRKLWLTGKTAAPSDRLTEVSEDDEMLTSYMTRTTYDPDEDGIVDLSESTVISAVASEALSIGNAICLVDGEAAKGKATTAELTPCIGFARANTLISASASIIVGGLVTPTTDSALVPDEPVFLSAATAGNVTPTPPSVAGQYIQQVGIAKTTTTMIVSIQEAVLLA